MFDDLDGRAALPCWEVRLLGGFELRTAGQPVRIGAVEGRLLAFLSLHPPAVTREFAAATLWPPTADGRPAAGALRTAVWRLNRAASGVVEASRDRLMLAGQVRTDCAQSRDAAERILAGDEMATLQAVALLEHDLLPGWYEDWVLVEGERHRQLRLHALEAAARTLVGIGRHGQAVDAARLAIAAEPLRESAHRALIEAQLAQGNRAEALRDYRGYRDLLAVELGLPPGPALRALVAAALAEEPAPPSMAAIPDPE
jgi:DNA-binding SARP family transcriptional activator